MTCRYDSGAPLVVVATTAFAFPSGHQALDIRTVISGQRKGPVATLLRIGLRFLTLPYGIAVGARNRQFDSGKRETIRVDCPVISVGNLTTGGTGKTPIVAYLARWFRDQGIRVSIVSRGYGRGDADHNDEAEELHQRLPDVPHLQDPDRVASAQIAIDELEAQIILMDDGFQHRRLGRDLNIVLIDMTCPFGHGYLLPRGLLREPIASLARADVVILTRTDQVSEQQIHAVEQQIRKTHASVPVIYCVHQPSGLLQSPSTTKRATELIQQRVALISGIGNPSAFRQSVVSLGAEVIDEFILPDHAQYDAQTMAKLDRWAQALDSVDALVCTHKDLVKIQSDRIGKVDLWALLIEAELANTQPLIQRLESLKQQAINGLA